jgi:hypothetical protein
LANALSGQTDRANTAALLDAPARQMTLGVRPELAPIIKMRQLMYQRCL